MAILFPCQDGSTLVVSTDAEPLRLGDGTIVGAMLTFREVKGEEELARMLALSQRNFTGRERGRRFLSLLHEALCELDDPGEVVETTTRMLGAELGASRCTYGTIDVEADEARVLGGYAPGGESPTGTYPFSLFVRTIGGEISLERTAAIADVASDPGTRDRYALSFEPLGIRALLVVRLVRRGRPVAFFSVARPEPHEWTPDEARLAEDVAERTWSAIERLDGLRALRASEARFRTMVEGMPMFAWTGRPDGSRDYLSPQWLAYTGRREEDSLGDGWLEAVHPNDRAAVAAAWGLAVAEGIRYEARFRLRRHDGEYRYFQSSGLPVQGERGEVVDWVGASADVHDFLEAQTELETKAEQLRRASRETFDRLARAAALRDDDTAEHTSRVGRLAFETALALGMGRQEAGELGWATELHDLGKIGVPDALLRKAGPLTPEERATMETHVGLGVALLEGCESPLLRLATLVAASHHERWDGGGYPKGLRGPDIPLAGRIVAVADAYDAMTQDRPYRRAMAPEKAREILREGSGAQWDPAVVEAFLRRSLLS